MKTIIIAKQVLKIDDEHVRDFDTIRKLFGKYDIKATYIDTDVD